MLFPNKRGTRNGENFRLHISNSSASTLRRDDVLYIRGAKISSCVFEGGEGKSSLLNRSPNLLHPAVLNCEENECFVPAAAATQRERMKG